MYDDARTIDPNELPDFDLICGGFPCQSFSIAGKRGGFNDARGTLFFEIARIAAVKKPKFLLLENVPGWLSHDQGRTFASILGALDEVRTNSEATTRRADILDDILHSNEYQHLSEQRKQRVKAMFKGYKNVSSAMKQELMDLGMTISDDGKHYKLTYRDDPRYMVTIGKTPSDNRAGNNNAALINKIML